MVEITAIVTVGSILVAIVGGTFTIRDQVRKSKEDSERRIISAIQREITPISISIDKDREKTETILEQKEASIVALWKDLESLEDHLNALEVQVAKHTGVIDTQTPLIVEIRNSIDVLRGKIELIQQGLNIK